MPMERREASATTSSSGKAALGENIQHLAADIAGGADDRDFIRHHASPSGRATAGR